MNSQTTDLTRKLPIGVQTFEKIRKEDYLYVDKSALVWQMANTGTVYFLSRPRRFGKSLLLSTFESYFQGRKDLFEGLAIENMEKDWNTHPVLHLDLNAEKYESVERLVLMLEQHLILWEDTWGKDEREITLSSRFTGVIRRAYEKTGRGVVVLIDEYDKPLLQTMFNEPLAEEYRNTLKAFYAVLKSSDRYLRFVLLTGVTKFAHVSIFSDLNQLNDISMDTQYSDVCGITEEELIATFSPEIERMGKRHNLSSNETVTYMKAQYDGYHFSKNSSGMFNPFSVLNSFSKQEFGNYWFQTGTPTFLVELLKRSNYDLRELIDGVETSPNAFTQYRVEADNPIPVFYQSGYLTIKKYDEEFGLYTLGFPNNEVRYAFLDFLLPYYTKITEDETSFNITRFVRELRAGQVDAFIERLRSFFADIPYELNDRTERHYQVVFYLVFTLLGQFTEAEVRSARGRADAVVKTKDHIYVFEFKLNGTAEEALRQIDEKGYLIPYLVDGREVVKVGVQFDAESRNIGEYLVD
ncbi:ATP-binding protein [Bacteroides sp. 519]|uniref:ATP-binding protein n=1 Tax=Bacteroides sp. 519 TaxID=2302937 RepID=UPI0013D25662|nr:ATP-binding protein [Bacteroides sp. 519]NDV60556.1 AAA family ATPase [Bacteroides sp. 519]